MAVFDHLRRIRRLVLRASLPFVLASLSACSASPPASDTAYPWHTDVIATTFWVGELFDPRASDGSQRYSTYDSQWMRSYGGCDGVVVDGICSTEERFPDNGYFPNEMQPLENPFYLDLPFDDINDSGAFERRDEVVPWANQPEYAAHRGDRTFSYMKNRWVELRKGDRTCFGQIEDAGPSTYNDADYVFGHDDQRPESSKFNGAGLDVSPALTSCLNFNSTNNAENRVTWRFVDEKDVPAGPWTRIVTKSQPQ